MALRRFFLTVFVMAAALSTARAELPADIKLISNLPYVPNGDPAEVLDLYLPQTPPDHLLPLIVHVHGGGWSGGSKLGGQTGWLARSGNYAVASVEYRFSQTAKFPAQIQDCQAALRWLRANAKAYNIDPNRVGLVGGSAGGHLVSLMGVTGGRHFFPPIGGNEDQSDAVQAVCDYFGPSDFTTVVDQAAKEPVANIFKFNTPADPFSKLTGVPLADDQPTRAVSPDFYVTKDAPPFLILHGTADRLVPFAQSVEFDKALRAAGVDTVFQHLPGAGHGGPQFELKAVRDLTFRFFDKHLRGIDTKVEPLPEADVTLPARPSTEPN